MATKPIPQSLAWCLAILSLMLLPAHGLRAQQHPFELADLAKLTGLSDPQFSPDGKSLIVVTSTPEYTEDQFLTDLVLVSIANGQQRALMQQRSGLSQPRWSPNGQELAFLMKTGTGKDAAPQLFALPLAGGEPRQITHTHKGVQHYAWRPDGGGLGLCDSR